MKVALFGIYSNGPEYPRQRNLIAGLKAAGVHVHECRYAMAGNFQERFKSATTVTGMIGFLGQILISYLSLSFQYFRAPRADALLVLYPGYFHVRLLKFLRFFKNRRAVIVYDIFFSLYDGLVLDRQIIRKSTLKAKAVHWLDRNACLAADIVLSDTHSHSSYLSDLLNLPRGKFHRVFVGPTFEPFSHPAQYKKDRFTVLYIGTYIPLHGVEAIIGAAENLKGSPDIQFHLVGKGQLREKIQELAEKNNLSNVTFTDWVPADELGEIIRSSDLALGIFGTTEKANRVIPIKVFDICAAGVLFITADTPAIREAFTLGENAWLVPAGDPEALAEAIRTLKENRELRERIAKKAQELAHTAFSVEEIGRELVEVIEARGRGGEGAKGR